MAVFKPFKAIRPQPSLAKEVASKPYDVLDSQEAKKDGVKVTEDINFKKFAERYSVPKNLIDLANKNQKGYLALKIVEIIGEDEVKNLDSETIYFITHLLNQTNLKKLRNEVLISALPQRS